MGPSSKHTPPFVSIPLEDFTISGSNVHLNVQSESLLDNRSDEQPASFNHRRVTKKKCCLLALCIAGIAGAGIGLVTAFAKRSSGLPEISERTITRVPTDSVLPTVTGQHTPDPMATSPVGIGEGITEPPLPASVRNFRGGTTAPWLEEVTTELTSHGIAKASISKTSPSETDAVEFPNNQQFIARKETDMKLHDYPSLKIEPPENASNDVEIKIEGKNCHNVDLEFMTTPRCVLPQHNTGCRNSFHKYIVGTGLNIDENYTTTITSSELFPDDYQRPLLLRLMPKPKGEDCAIDSWKVTFPLQEE